MEVVVACPKTLILAIDLCLMLKVKKVQDTSSAGIYTVKKTAFCAFSLIFNIV